MNLIELGADPRVLASRNKNLPAFARAVQMASHGRIGLTLDGLRIGDLEDNEAGGVDSAARDFLAEIIEAPLKPGNYPVEALLAYRAEGLGAGAALAKLYASHPLFASQDFVGRIESRQLKVFLLGSAGSGVVSAVQDLVAAFVEAGYHGRAFPMFDPSKKGAPVKGFGVVSREPILNHAPFAIPDIVLLFDPKLFPLLRSLLREWPLHDPKNIAILVNTSMEPNAFRTAANFHEPYHLCTLDADELVRGKRMPPNYALIGGMLNLLGPEAVDGDAFAKVVEESLTRKFGPGDKVKANLNALRLARQQVIGDAPNLPARAALGRIEKFTLPAGQEILCEEGNRAIARAVAQVLNQFPSVVAAYPITPQTAIVEYLAQMIADGEVSAESVTPESEHGAGGAIMGAARDRVLAFTASSSQGLALMSEILHTIAGMRMGNVVISNVVRSLNAPLDVENDHTDLYKIALDAGFVILIGRDVQQAYDFHLISWLIGLYAEYRKAPLLGLDGRVHRDTLEMVPDRSVMLPVIVATEGFEVSHAPERYLALSDGQAQQLYADPFFDYIRSFVFTPNESIMGALQLSNARMDTDYQRHQAMDLALEVIEQVFAKFAACSGRHYSPVQAWNPQAKTLFVVAGAANGTFEEVAREFAKNGMDVGVAHPNLLRPFPKAAWAKLIEGKHVFVYDRDDPFGAVGGRLYTELAGVQNEFDLAASGTRLFSRIYGMGGRTPSLAMAREEIVKALREQTGELALAREKIYVGVNL
ncbi:MAG: 2-oxoacid:acceptor oxidoreductase family protein [Sulfuritalea sp.]|jgi:pyruvate ferredoxin oxidoreductase alpha subunit|nr:2-oxoacid:acceptor oxidoreductase family protein [Sulfuritalea sp.]